MNKVYEDEKNLCNSCRFGITTRCGSAQFVRCAATTPVWQPPARVTECRAYDNRATPSIYDMERIAWVLVTDKGQKIGFRRPEELGGMAPLPSRSY